jgi:hypothetical protein
VNTSLRFLDSLREDSNRMESSAVNARMNANHLHRAAVTGLGLAALVLLAGCANGPGWGAYSKRPSDAEIAAVLARVEAQQIAQPQDDARQAPTAVMAASDR